MMNVRMAALLIFLTGYAWHAQGSVNLESLNAMTLLRQINDREKLLEIHKNDEKWEMRLMAAVRLGDIALLSAMVNNENEEYSAQHYAVGYLGDQGILADIAVNHSDWRLRDIATLYLDDKELLAEIAKKDEDETVRRDAERRLSDLISGRSAIYRRSGLPSKFTLENDGSKDDVKKTHPAGVVQKIDSARDVVVENSATEIQDVDSAHDVAVENDEAADRGGASSKKGFWMALFAVFVTGFSAISIRSRSKSKKH